MTCHDCDFWHANGGDCHGLKKNSEVRFLFYVCSHQEDREAVLKYWGGIVQKRETAFSIPSASFDPSELALARSPVLVS